MKLLSKIACLALFTILSINLNAQIRVGGKVGLNIATWNISDELTEEGIDDKSIIGTVFGGALEIGINNMISVQPELLFYQKGFKQEADFGGGTEKFIITLNYLEVPVLLKVKFGNAESTNFFVTGGPSIGYALSGTFGDGDTKEDIDFDDDEFSRIDFGLAVGGGVTIPAGPGRFVVDLRYLLGLSNLNDSEDDGEATNRGIGISLGYMLAIGE